MFDVAIVGAGELGGELAYALAKRDLADVVRLLDESGTVAAGKALDIAQAAPVERFSTKLSGSADVGTATRASLVVLADRVNGGEWTGEDGLALLRRLASAGSLPLVLCTGATQRELIERAVRELRLPRVRIFGSAPEALVGAVRAMIAIETGRSARDVSVTVLGAPPSQIVVPWEHAAIAGLAAAGIIDTPARRRLEARIAQLWPPGPRALAMAAAKAVEALTGRSRQVMSCFVGPDDSAGRRTRAAALPAKLGVEGIDCVELPPLTTHDRVALDTALLL